MWQGMIGQDILVSLHAPFLLCTLLVLHIIFTFCLLVFWYYHDCYQVPLSNIAVIHGTDMSAPTNKILDLFPLFIGDVYMLKPSFFKKSKMLHAQVPSKITNSISGLCIQYENFLVKSWSMKFPLAEVPKVLIASHLPCRSVSFSLSSLSGPSSVEVCLADIRLVKVLEICGTFHLLFFNSVTFFKQIILSCSKAGEWLLCLSKETGSPSLISSQAPAKGAWWR